MNLALWQKKKKKVTDSLPASKLKNSSKKKFNNILKFLQELGKALQFPIAVLPFAAILNRFGTLGITFSTVDGTIINQVGYWISFIIQQPGAVVFNNLPLLFAIGIAFGLAKDHRGEVALVGAIFYLIIAALTSVANTLPEMFYKNVLPFKTANGSFSRLIYVPVYDTDGTTIKSGTYVLNIGVLGGIIAGCISASLYNRYQSIKLPQALSFFGGRRFVPMMALVVTVPVAFLFAIVWPWIQFGLMGFGQAVANPNNPAVAIPGTAVYGVLNRLLLPFGLHQILNTFFWFQLPINGPAIAPITGESNNLPIWVNGDIHAFTKGIAGSGLFQSGFFPIMMGGIPAVALAMIFTANKENRSKMAGFLGGIALVSFISGITEPIEFSFVFISPLLLVIHALLTGVVVAITTAMHVQVGFGFSAGMIDYIVSFAQSWGFANHNTGIARVLANPLWILLLTAGTGGLYFVVFYTLITKLNIQTPGRETIVDTNIIDLADSIQEKERSSENKVNKLLVKEEKFKKDVQKGDKYQVLAENIITAIGRENFVDVENCISRLRLTVKDTSKIDKEKIRAAGTYGILIVSKETLQIVIGTDVEAVADSMRKSLNL